MFKNKKLRKGILIIFLLLIILNTVLFFLGFSKDVKLIEIREDTKINGDLLIDNDKKYIISNSTLDVEGSVILRDNGKLQLNNSKLISNRVILYDTAQLLLEKSNYSKNIEATSFSIIRIINSTLSDKQVDQVIELNEGASIFLYNTFCGKTLIRLSGPSEAIIDKCGPNIAIQTGIDSSGNSLASVNNSMVPLLSVFGNSNLEAENSTLGNVAVSQNGILHVKNCVIAGSMGYYDHHSTLEIENCFVNTLIDGIIYYDQSLTLSGEEIKISNYREGVNNINSTIAQTKYILYLTGENGRYSLNNLTKDVVRILIDSSKVEARKINQENLIFFTGGEAQVSISDSNFNRLLSKTTTSLKIYNCTLNSIDHTNDIIDLLEIVNSSIIANDGPAIYGGWATDTLIDSSIIKGENQNPDINIAFLNKLELRKISNIIFNGKMCVSVKTYNSEVTFSGMSIDRIYNHLNNSKISFISNSSYGEYLTEPPNIIVKDIKISPKRIPIGKEAIFEVTLENIGDLTAEDTISLYIDGENKREYDVRIVGRENKEIEYCMIFDQIGKHNIEILGVTEDFPVVNPWNPIEIIIKYWSWITGIIIILSSSIIIYLRERNRIKDESD